MPQAMIDTISDRDVFDLNQLGPLFGPDEDRRSLVRLRRRATSMGYATFIASMDWEALKREQRPIITRVPNEASPDDFVLLQGILGDEIVMVDGELRVRRLIRREFLHLWSGWVAILHRCIQSVEPKVHGLRLISL